MRWGRLLGQLHLDGIPIGEVLVDAYDAYIWGGIAVAHGEPEGRAK